MHKLLFIDFYIFYTNFLKFNNKSLFKFWMCDFNNAIFSCFFLHNFDFDFWNNLKFEHLKCDIEFQNN